ncbi:uncharacterized protein LOC144453910 [Glandiceps talaboti]
MNGKKCSLPFDIKGEGIVVNKTAKAGNEGKGDANAKPNGTDSTTGENGTKLNGQKVPQTPRSGKTDASEQGTDRKSPASLVILKGLYSNKNPIYLGPRVRKPREQQPRTDTSKT